MRNETLSIAFLISLAVHLSAILMGAVVVHESRAPSQELLPVKLIDMPRREPPVLRTIEAPRQIKKPPPPPPVRLEKPKGPPMAKSAIVKSEPITPMRPARAREESAKTTEPKQAVPAELEPSPFASGSPVEGGGSAAGAGSLFSNGNVGVVPGPGSAGGGGTAAAGVGRGAGAPGLPAQSVLRTRREAKPIETVHAKYPPMALRAGLESDVTLKIEVDAQGNVTRAAITKSGGSGFDEEALKAVQQSRFEPAQRDGQNISAEFTYIYRFRLRR